MDQLKKIPKPIRLIIFIICGGLSLTAAAGGFQLFEENVTNLGNAYAGMSAEANDASTEFFNPAGMTRLDNGQVVASGTYIDVYTRTNVQSATSTISAPPIFDVESVVGTTESHPTPGAMVPSFHFVYPFDHKWALGFGVNAPFGLETEYPSDSIVRYLATRSEVQVIDLGPSLAYQFTPQFSLGAGLDSQWMSATFNQSIANLDGGTAGNFLNDGSDWAWGWHAGALYQFDECTRVGLAYHSRVKHDLKGDALLDLENIVIGPVSLADRLPGKFTASATLPDYGDISLYHQFNPEWAFLGDVEFTHWSLIKTLTVNYSGDIANNDTIEINSAQLPFDFRNTWRVSAGVNFMPSDRWTLRTGVAYDESPVPNASARTFRLPDTNRYWVAFGAQYIINRAFTVDAGYSHLFVNKTSINNTQQFNALLLPGIPLLMLPATITENGIGDVEAGVNELGVQLTWNIPNAYS